MSQVIAISTRKGLFVWGPDGGSTSGWKVVDSAFVGEPVSLALYDERTDRLWAALAHGHFGTKLQVADGYLAALASGADVTWTEKPAPRFEADTTVEDGKEAPSVGQAWALAHGGPDRPGRLWCGVAPGALFRSEDDGESWQLMDALWQREERAHWFGGGADVPTVHSVLVDPRDNDHVTIGVSCGGVWQTHDAGASWELTAEGMFAAFMPPSRSHDPRIQDPHAIAQCLAEPDVLWCQHHNAAFRSTDGGKRWQSIQPRPSVFGFPVAAHPTDPNRAWFVPAVKDEMRVPVDGAVVVARTDDGGQTFEVCTEGLPQEQAWDIIYRHALAIDTSGEKLAMGSTTGNAWLSDDGGRSWLTLSHHMPPIHAVMWMQR